MKISSCLLRAVALGSSTDSPITHGPATLKGAPRTNAHAIPLYYVLRVSTTRTKTVSQEAYTGACFLETTLRRWPQAGFTLAGLRPGTATELIKVWLQLWTQRRSMETAKGFAASMLLGASIAA